MKRYTLLAFFMLWNLGCQSESPDADRIVAQNIRTWNTKTGTWDLISRQEYTLDSLNRPVQGILLQADHPGEDPKPLRRYQYQWQDTLRISEDAWDIQDGKEDSNTVVTRIFEYNAKNHLVRERQLTQKHQRQKIPVREIRYHYYDDFLRSAAVKIPGLGISSYQQQIWFVKQDNPYRLTRTWRPVPTEDSLWQLVSQDSCTLITLPQHSIPQADQCIHQTLQPTYQALSYDTPLDTVFAWINAEKTDLFYQEGLIKRQETRQWDSTQSQWKDSFLLSQWTYITPKVWSMQERLRCVKDSLHCTPLHQIQREFDQH